jgi:hypothetical protein
MKRNYAMAAYESAVPELTLVHGHEVRRCAVEGCDNLAMDRRDCWTRRFQSALEIWLIVWDWLCENVVDYVLLFFVLFALGYIGGRFADVWIQWLVDLAKG